MKTFPKLQRTLLLATVLTAVTACSSGPVVQDYPITANAQEELTKLEGSIKTAQANQVDVLSPDNYADATEAYDDAKKMHNKGKDADKVLHEIAVGNAYMTNANAVAEVARENMEGVVSARQAALEAGATTYFSKQMKDIDKDTVDVTEDIENNKLSSAVKNRKELQERYLALELKAIQEKHLGESRKTISLAKQEKAEKFEPRTLAVAEKSVVDTEAFIIANRHDTPAIEARAAETKEAAMHALNINRTAKGTNKVSSEESALAIEKERFAVAAKDSQLTNVKGQLSNVAGQLNATRSALEGSADTNAALLNAQQKLENEKALNERYEVARKEFNSNEAEVYKQGDKLLIRLKGMAFPTAKATISEDNKNLLAKVHKVMADFGTSSVIVEGHTDSIGGKKSNETLSQNRADAVKDYLQENNGGISDESSTIKAVGYGYQKPLATNKTADGRAQNRRVDIIIKPEAVKTNDGSTNL